MHATRHLPTTMLDHEGRATCVALHAISLEAHKRGLRYVPAAARPARIAPCDGLWMAPGNGAHLILIGATLMLVGRT